MEIILETERLILRKFDLNDTDFIIALLNSEGWLKYIGDRNVKTTEQAIGYLENGPLKVYKNNDYGLYLVALKPGAVPVGMCGLVKRDYLDHLDIGFSYLPEYNGKGYAFEMASKVLQFAFEKLGKEKIQAITIPGNAPSIKLLEKLGLKYEQTITTPDSNEELLLYGIEK